MKIYNKSHNGFSVSPVFLILLLATAVFFLASCGESSTESKVALEKVEKSPEEIKDTSMEFSGNIARATCQECHPAVKEGKSDIDLEKVKAAGMIRGKNMDIPKMKQKQIKDTK